jgi:M6 family metalloprotease-like protein
MKRSYSNCARFVAIWLGLIVITAGSPQPLTAATPADFGYQRMNVNGQLASGTRPLLVLICNFDGGAPVTTTPDMARRLIFDSGNTQSVNGFFREVSNGQFSWTNAGIIGPVPFSAGERARSFSGDYFSNKIYKALVSVNFDLGQYDSNGDTNVSPDELQIMAISNDPSDGLRAFNSIRLPYTPFTVGCSGNCLIDLGEALARQFALYCHESSHALGAVDLYGTDQHFKPAHDATLMRTWSNGSNTFHLDPWHKMQIGWSEPRLVDVRNGGVFNLPAAQMQSSGAPLVLYDLRRGIHEFFMLEYRTPISPTLINYDRHVASTGLVVWHVSQDGNKAHTPVPPLWTGLNGELGWAECTNCHALYYQVFEASSFCPETRTNHYAGGGNFLYLSTLFNYTAPSWQAGWRRCWKCMGLFFGNNSSSSDCPRGGRHDGAGSRDYSVSTNTIYPTVSTNYITAIQAFPLYRCTKCEGMFAGARQAQSTCPQDQLAHDAILTSTNYLPTYDQGVFTLGAPNLIRNGTQFWGSDTTTPTLLWLDNTPTRTTLRVRPFSTGSGDITVEVLCAEDSWVDFNFAGSPRNGSFDRPYRTLAEGVGNAAWGGVLNFKPGSSSEIGLITKPLTFVAPLPGTVTIGE